MDFGVLTVNYSIADYFSYSDYEKSFDVIFFNLPFEFGIYNF